MIRFHSRPESIALKDQWGAPGRIFSSQTVSFLVCLWAPVSTNRIYGRTFEELVEKPILLLNTEF